MTLEVIGSLACAALQMPVGLIESPRVWWRPVGLSQTDMPARLAGWLIAASSCLQLRQGDVSDRLKQSVLVKPGYPFKRSKSQ